LTKITVKNPALPDDATFSIPGINNTFKNGDSYDITEEDHPGLVAEYGEDWQKGLEEAGLAKSSSSSSKTNDKK